MMSLMRTRVLTRKASMGYTRKWEWQAVSHRALVSSTVQNKNNFSYNDCSTPWLAMVASALLVSLTTVSSMTLIHSESLDQDNQSNNKTLPYISRDEVKKHTTEDTGVWVTYNDGVFDLTSFIANHPGGKDKIFLAAGKDLSELWQQPPYQLHYRSPLVFELLEEHRIGNLPVEDIKVDEFQRNIRTRKVKKTYSTSKIYECVIVGSGLAGLQCANSLIDTCSDEISQDDVLILEASDYVGGRVKQIDSFVAGIPIDVGAEFLHGGNTVLARTASENGDELKELFCWAQGDGGPLPMATDNGGFGLYYLGGEGRSRSGVKCKEKLLRFDDKDEEFIRLNETLEAISSLDTNDFDADASVHDFLVSQNFSDEMLSLAEAGFSNTMCTNSKDLSMKQSIRWQRFWNEEEGDDGDYVFVNSFKNFISRLRGNLQVELNSPVVAVQHPKTGDDLGLVKLTTEDGTVYYAKNVVITASPPVIASKMKFQPPLSEEMDEALNSVLMQDVIKVFLKFSEPAWPKNLHGVIMAGNENFLVPEVWFKDIDPTKVDPDEPARGLAICYTTSDFAKRLAELPKDEVLKRIVEQLDQVFSNLEERHMSAIEDTEGNKAELKRLKKPSEAYLGGMFWDWNAQHQPYITGGYCSPRAGKNTESIKVMSKPYGHAEHAIAEGIPTYAKRLFFAGEATSETAGATAHAAMGSGERAAAQVAKNIQGGKDL